jgi:hypothetical protein
MPEPVFKSVSERFDGEVSAQPYSRLTAWRTKDEIRKRWAARIGRAPSELQAGWIEDIAEFAMAAKRLQRMRREHAAKPFMLLKIENQLAGLRRDRARAEERLERSLTPRRGPGRPRRTIAAHVAERG